MSAMTEMVAETLWHLEADIDKRGWDQPDLLVMVMIHPIDGQHGLVEMREVVGWEDALDAAANLQQALSALAHSYRSVPKAVKEAAIPPNLFALALVSEAWILRVPIEQAQEVLDYASKHRVGEHKDRVEVRMVYLKPVAGSDLVLMHERDGITEVVDESNYGGGVPPLLGDVLLAMTS